MITVLMLVLIAILAVIGLLILARGQSPSITAVAQLQGRTRPVDVAAFRNLVDIDEEDYLRERLSKEDFKAIHRERMKAAIEYLHCVAGNAAVLLRLGESARRSADPEVVTAGQELVNDALMLRVFVLLTEAKLYATILLPGLRFTPDRVASSYENLTGAVMRLGMLQKYVHVGRIAATL